MCEMDSFSWMSFTFGVLSTVAVLFVAIIVVGVAAYNKQQANKK